jgi:enoyl-CoA hydratase/carnithine racemase
MTVRLDNPLAPNFKNLGGYAAQHFQLAFDANTKVARITLNRPEKKNPLTFESYAELRDFFRAADRGESL